MTHPVVYVCIGNSDDKLPQHRWSDFCSDFIASIEFQETHHEYIKIHGVWFSAPDSAYQNMCICFEILDVAVISPLRSVLMQLAIEYHQDSISWTEAKGTEFLGSSPSSIGD